MVDLDMATMGEPLQTPVARRKSAHCEATVRLYSALRGALALNYSTQACIRADSQAVESDDGHRWASRISWARLLKR